MLKGLSGADEALQKIYESDTLSGYINCVEAYLNALVKSDDIYIHPELAPELTLDTVKFPT